MPLFALLLISFSSATGPLLIIVVNNSNFYPLRLIIYFQVILFLHLTTCVPHPQADHHIYSSSDLLAVDSNIHSYSVRVAAPQSFLQKLDMDSQADTKQMLLPTPLPGRGPRQGALAGNHPMDIKNKLIDST